MIPYSTQQISEADVLAVREVLQSSWLTQGPVVPRFEAAFAARHDADHAIAMSNATACLHSACIALGVGNTSRVWTSPNSFVASANCAVYCGASVDFVDIDPRTRNISIVALEEKLVAAATSGRLPHVVIPVAFAGLPCDLQQIWQLAERYGFKVLQDASHAVGAAYQRQPIGSQYAHATVFSFHPVKIITTGEGGMVTTNDATLASRLRLLRSHGITREQHEMTGPAPGEWYYEQVTLGFNYRMTDMQAALGVSQLARLEEMSARRRYFARRYDTELRNLPLHLPVEVPTDRESSWHLYVVEIDANRTAVQRAEIFSALRKRGIGVNVHYIPIHLQPFYRRMGYSSGQFPNAEAYYDAALTLPLFPSMTEAQQDEVVGALSELLGA